MSSKITEALDLAKSIYFNRIIKRGRNFFAVKIADIERLAELINEATEEHSALLAARGVEKMSFDHENWKIEHNSAGFVYVLNEHGKKICTVYGTAEQKLQLAMAICELPKLLADINKVAADD